MGPPVKPRESSVVRALRLDPSCRSPLHFFVSSLFTSAIPAKKLSPFRVPTSGKALPVVLSLITALGLSGAAFFLFLRQPEISPVARGEKLAVASGCFACHGRSEAEERFDLRQTSPGAWKAKNIPTVWEDGVDKADVIIDWITHGVPARGAERHRQLLIQMPAFEKYLSAEEIDSLAAWVIAEGLRLTQGHGNADREAPPMAAAEVSKLTSDKLLVIGDRLSRKNGCYQCHGEFGQGGVANPSSFKSTIPGFYGHEFRELTAEGDRAEILHWINHGRGQAIESGLTGRIAKGFLNRQAIGMPGYRDHLGDTEKIVLTDYLLLLNKTGPMKAKGVERVGQLLNEKKTKKEGTED